MSWSIFWPNICYFMHIKNCASIRMATFRERLHAHGLERLIQYAADVAAEGMVLSEDDITQRTLQDCTDHFEEDAVEVFSRSRPPLYVLSKTHAVSHFVMSSFVFSVFRVLLSELDLLQRVKP